MKRYVLSFNSYREALTALRKLRRRGVKLQLVVIVVVASDHRKLRGLRNNKVTATIVV